MSGLCAIVRPFFGNDRRVSFLPRWIWNVIDYEGAIGGWQASSVKLAWAKDAQMVYRGTLGWSFTQKTNPGRIDSSHVCPA